MLELNYDKSSAIKAFIDNTLDTDTLILQASVLEGLDNKQYKELFEAYPTIKEKEEAYRHNYTEYLYRPDELLGNFYVIMFDEEKEEGNKTRKYLIICYSRYSSKVRSLHKDFDTKNQRKAWLWSCIEKVSVFLAQESSKRFKEDKERKLSIALLINDFKYFKSLTTDIDLSLLKFVDSKIGPKIHSYFNLPSLTFTIFKKK